MNTIEILKKWADCVRLENFLTQHGVKWRCTIGSIEAEDYSLEVSVQEADRLTAEHNQRLTTGDNENES